MEFALKVEMKTINDAAFHYKGNRKITTVVVYSSDIESVESYFDSFFY
ncbi:hypothetical protein [Clostridium sp.]|jgi:hypothetical protein